MYPDQTLSVLRSAGNEFEETSAVIPEESVTINGEHVSQPSQQALRVNSADVSLAGGVARWRSLTRYHLSLSTMTQAVAADRDRKRDKQ